MDKTPLLGLDYSPEISPRHLRELEQQARRAGLPLELLELIAQDPELVRSFILHARHGAAQTFVDGLDVEALRLQRHTRTRYADRLAAAANAVPPAVSIT